MTKEKKQKTTDSPSLQEIQESQESKILELEGQNQLLQEIIGLSDKNYYNRRVLAALERIAKALEDSLPEEEEDDEEEEDEEG